MSGLSHTPFSVIHPDPESVLNLSLPWYLAKQGSEEKKKTHKLMHHKMQTIYSCKANKTSELSSRVSS